MDLSGLEDAAVAGDNEHNSDTSSPINGGEFLE
jgi:hypothetical protein